MTQITLSNKAVEPFPWAAIDSFYRTVPFVRVADGAGGRPQVVGWHAEVRGPGQGQNPIDLSSHFANSVIP